MYNRVIIGSGNHKVNNGVINNERGTKQTT